MTAQDDLPDLPQVYWTYFQCGDNVGRLGNDVGPDYYQPVPDGCFEITKEEYDRIHGEHEASRLAAVEAAHAAEAQAEDDRITDLVAVKVAEILAAQNRSDTP